jgi:hypothetical protein
MGNRLIFLYLNAMRCGDGEGWAGRVLDVPVQACRRILQANPEGQRRGVMTRRLGAEVADTTLPGKATKLQLYWDRTANRHRWAG